MDMIVEHVDVWAAPISDKPGGLSLILKGMQEAGADLDFVVARRSPEKPGSGVMFIAPIRGDKEVRAASTLGFNLTSSVDAVRVEGDNKPGAAARLTELMADAGINVRGVSMAVTGPRFIAYIGFDSHNDAQTAISTFQDEGSELIQA